MRLPHNIIPPEWARQSAAGAYLAPVLARPNLDVVTSADARRLVMDGSRCRAVEYTSDGGRHVVEAGWGVVLAAGTIGSAQLLLLSGIGPAAQLRELGIGVVATCPGWGRTSTSIRSPAWPTAHRGPCGPPSSAAGRRSLPQ